MSNVYAILTQVSWFTAIFSHFSLASDDIELVEDTNPDDANVAAPGHVNCATALIVALPPAVTTESAVIVVLASA